MAGGPAVPGPIKTGDKAMFEHLRGGPYNTIFGGIGHGGSISQGRGGLRAMSVSRLQNYFLVGSVCGAATILLGPWIIENWREMLHLDFDELDAADVMPILSKGYWINEWRKGDTPWRGGEAANPEFYVENMNFVKRATGRDYANPSSWFKPRPEVEKILKSSTGVVSVAAKAPAAPHKPRERHYNIGNTTFTDAMIDSLPPPSVIRAATEALNRKKLPVHVPGSAPRAFVPFCGDSRITLELAKMGYEVDALDVSDVAIRALVERTEAAAPKDIWSRIHVHLSDFYDADFWRELGATILGPDGRPRGSEANASTSTVASDGSELKNSEAAVSQAGGGLEVFDFIYDRHALSAANPKDRPDYAFLLKRSLKPGGAIMVEGVLRTPHVKGNTFRGPPFRLGLQDLQDLFPSKDGYVVKCSEAHDQYLQDFGPEVKVTGIIDPRFWQTFFPCAVLKTGKLEQVSAPSPVKLARSE